MDNVHGHEIIYDADGKHVYIGPKVDKDHISRQPAEPDDGLLLITGPDDPRVVDDGSPIIAKGGDGSKLAKWMKEGKG